MIAEQRYLQRHIEPGLPDCPRPAQPWQHVLVIPAYRESPELLQRLAGLPAGTGHCLVILVLNRPDSDADQQANNALREAAGGPADRGPADRGPADGQVPIRKLNDHSDLYLHDLDRVSGAIAASQGVGLARKSGCDLAFKWHSQGAISSPWICSSDADALLPADYFLRLDSSPAGAVAAVYPFQHVPGPDPACNRATALYELRMHHYVLGLEYAASPYAYHSLGSCLAVPAGCYAQVRGFPKRAGGEDFYLLNKLAKLGPIARLSGQCITLQSRHSRRAPFGTGPAVAKIAAATDPANLALFYHPACFEALGCMLAAVPTLWPAGRADLCAQLYENLGVQGLAAPLVQACREAGDGMGLAAALAHCRRQGKSADQFLRQFHQWFDGFRTLKFVHAIRDAGWPGQSLAALQTLQPQLWPYTESWTPQQLCEAVMQHWGWTG